jgi:hypothetical protein
MTITATRSYSEGDSIWTLTGDEDMVLDLVDHLPEGWVSDGVNVVYPVLSGPVSRLEIALDRAAFRRGMRIEFVSVDETLDLLRMSLAVTRALKGKVA